MSWLAREDESMRGWGGGMRRWWAYAVRREPFGLAQLLEQLGTAAAVHDGERGVVLRRREGGHCVRVESYQ